MERNLSFDTAALQTIAVKLGWAQLEIFADDVEKIQVLVAGDEHSVSDLRIAAEGDALVVEQPQYGLSIKITESKCMQICIRVPRTWEKKIDCSTISGLLSARGLHGSAIELETVSGDLRALRLQAPEIRLKTVSGDVRGEKLDAPQLTTRSVSGDVSLTETKANAIKSTAISGAQNLNLISAFERFELTAVSGNVVIVSPADQANVQMHAVSGRVKTEGVTTSEAGPLVRATGVSADLTLICAKPAADEQ